MHKITIAKWNGNMNYVERSYSAANALKFTSKTGSIVFITFVQEYLH